MQFIWRTPIETFLAGNHVNPKDCIKNCFYIYSPVQNRLSFLGKIRSGSWVFHWTSGSMILLSSVISSITSRKDRNCLLMLPKRTIHQCVLDLDFCLSSLHWLSGGKRRRAPCIVQFHLWSYSLFTPDMHDFRDLKMKRMVLHWFPCIKFCVSCFSSQPWWARFCHKHNDRNLFLPAFH